MSEAGCAQSAEVVQMEKELQDLFEKWRGTKGSLIILYIKTYIL
jgi:hypothetical protein